MKKTDARRLKCLAQGANDEHTQVIACLGASLEHACDAGKFLTEAKNLPHGQWDDWLANNFEESERTARNYMRISRDWARLTNGKKRQRRCRFACSRSAQASGGAIQLVHNHSPRGADRLPAS